MVKKKSKKQAKKVSRSAGFQVGKRDMVAVALVVLAVVVAYAISGTGSSGLVELDIVQITVECDDCLNISALSQGLSTQEGVSVERVRSIDYKSSEAQKLIEKHGITRVPALVVNSDRIEELPSNEILTLKKDVGVFDKSVPYVDVDSGKMGGVVTLTEVSSTCTDICPKAEQVKVQLEGAGVKIVSATPIDETSKEGEARIEELGLKFTPAVILSKEIEEYWWVFPQISNAFVKQGDSYIFRSPVPPYKDLEAQEIKGKVTVTYLQDPSCIGCFQPELMKRSFEEFGVHISEEKNVTVDSTPGKALITKYNITKVPTAIFSKDIAEYVPLRQTLNQIGTFEAIDQSFIIRNHDLLQAKYNTV